LLSFGAESFVFHVAISNTKLKIYRSIILPVDLYGCDTGSLILREEHRLRVFQNSVLRRKSEPKRDEGPIIPHGLTANQTTTLYWWVYRSIMN
jgi:hypothetical protein